jgi:hypothetical protein
MSDFLSSMWWLFAAVYGFAVWGFWWGIFSIFIPILPIIDFVKYYFVK